LSGRRQRWPGSSYLLSWARVRRWFAFSHRVSWDLLRLPARPVSAPGMQWWQHHPGAPLCVVRPPGAAPRAWSVDERRRLDDPGRFEQRRGKVSAGLRTEQPFDLGQPDVDRLGLACEGDVPARG
jgi:hypothetical protein